jgi:Flp pilus assembly protein TadB
MSIPPPSGRVAADPSNGRTRTLSSCALGVAVAWFFGGTFGCVAGAIAALVAFRFLGGLESSGARRRREQCERDVPIAANLMSACLAAGAQPAQAASAVADAVPGPVGVALDGVVARLTVGVDPVEAWRGLTEVPGMASWGRAVARAIETGASLADTMTDLAEDRRAARRSEAQALANRIGVRATLPLGLCFLPAFVVLGVIPLVGAMTSAMWSSLTH